MPFSIIYKPLNYYNSVPICMSSQYSILNSRSSQFYMYASFLLKAGCDREVTGVLSASLGFVILPSQCFLPFLAAGSVTKNAIAHLTYNGRI